MPIPLSEISDEYTNLEMITFAMSGFGQKGTRGIVKAKFNLTTKEVDSVMARARTRVFNDSIWKPKDDHRHNIMDVLDKIIETGSDMFKLQACRLKMDLLRLATDDPLPVVIDNKQLEVKPQKIDKLLTNQKDRDKYFNKLG